MSGFDGKPRQPLPEEEQTQLQSQEQVMDDLIGDLQDDMQDLIGGLNTSRDTYELSDSDDESPSHVFGGGESSIAASSKPATAASSPAKTNFETPATSPAKSKPGTDTKLEDRHPDSASIKKAEPTPAPSSSSSNKLSSPIPKFGLDDSGDRTPMAT